jgi:hypothetical protein
MSLSATLRFLLGAFLGGRFHSLLGRFFSRLLRAVFFDFLAEDFSGFFEGALFFVLAFFGAGTASGAIAASPRNICSLAFLAMASASMSRVGITAAATASPTVSKHLSIIVHNRLPGCPSLSRFGDDKSLVSWAFARYKGHRERMELHL